MSNFTKVQSGTAYNTTSGGSSGTLSFTLASVLAGDVWRDDNPFQQKLMASKRRRKELVPELRT